MTFRESLEEHLRAIKSRDLPSLMMTLPEGELTLIRPDGRCLRSVDEYVALYRDWFASSTWTIETRLEELTECDALGLAIVHVTYRDEPPDRDRWLQRAFHTFAFAREGSRWVLIHDQATPIQPLDSP
ncbi:Cif family virulence factor [Tautonia rosea]|uniref:nuclear transport factor 2 family protein n=1 Tax=Tautonia rosea TaxID=2728037 RepID=UPI00147627D3|nr:nuclear transport factor 2 family protein [Tautonia rosea]